MTVTVNVLDAKTTLATHKVPEKEALVLNAQNNVNYQLVDDQTGFGPQNILTKREGNDLLIMLEDGDVDADIIIKDYYSQEGASNLVVGLHENGQIYAYVPESANAAESISVLADQVIAPQALGGESLVTPFWAFNPWWLVGAAALVGGVALAAHSGSKGGEAAATEENVSLAAPTVASLVDGAILLDLPSDAAVGETVEVIVTPAGSTEPVTVTLTKGENGWTSDNEALIPSSTANNPNSITIPAGALQDATIVEAVRKDPNGNQSNKATAEVDGTAPSAPELTADSANNAVNVALPPDAKVGDMVEVTIIPEGSTTPIVVPLTKQPDGSWASSDPSRVPSTTADNPNTLSIPNLSENTVVSAVAKDPVGNKSNPEAPKSTVVTPDLTAPSAPELTPNEDGSVGVKLPMDAKVGDTVEIQVVPENGKDPITVTFTKGENGWTSDNPSVIPSTNSNEATIPAGQVKDGSNVTAIAKDPSGNESSPVKTRAQFDEDETAPSAPKAEGKANGDVEVDFPTDAEVGDIVEVTFTPKGATEPVTVPFTKDENGNWVSGNKDLIPSPEGDKLTIPADNVEDNTPVSVVAKDPAGNESPVSETTAKTPDTTAPSAPKLTPSTKDGSVAVELPEDAEVGDTVEITVTPEGADEPVTVTLTKQPDGTWASDKPETVPSTTAENPNSTEIPEGQIEDGSEVNAVAKDPAGNSSDPAAPQSKATAGEDKDNDAPSAPKVTANEDGSVSIELPTDAEEGDTVEVSVTPEGADEPITVTLTKGDNGWTSDNPEVVPSTETNETTIPEDQVKDNSDVTAIAKDPSGNSSEPTDPQSTATVGDVNAPSAPVVTAKTNGDVEVDLPTDAEIGDTVEVSVVPEGQTEPVTVTLTKGEDGWTSNNEDLIPSPEGDKATIPADKVADESPVSAVAKDPAGNESEPTETSSDTVKTPDTTAPSAPKLTPSTEDGSVAVELPEDAEAGDTVEVTVTPEGADEPVTVTLTKQPDGTWASDKPETVPSTTEENPNSTVIPEGQLEDGSEVSAVAKDPAGNESKADPVKAGDDADQTAPSAPEVTASKEDGSVNVKLPEDAQNGDTVEVTLTPEGAKDPITVTLTKGDNGWTSDNPEVVPSTETNETTIPEGQVKDGADVTAVAKDPSGNESTPSSDRARADADQDAPSTPEVTAKPNGDVEVDLPTDAEEGDTVEVTVTPEGSDEPVTVTLTKGPDGWTSDNEDLIPSPEGDKATIPADKVEDNTPVTAVAKDPSGNESEPSTADAKPSDTTAPSAPEVTASEEDGSVTVELPKDAEEGDTVEITVTPEGSDQPETVTLTKQPDGTWASDKPEIVPSTTADNPNSTTIPEAKVEDGSEVSAVAKDPAGNSSDPAAPQSKATAGEDKDNDAPSAPVVEASDEDGSVNVKLPEDAQNGDTVEVTLTPEGAKDPITVTLTKGDNGWISDNPEIVPSTENNDITIHEGQVKDGSKVTAVAKDPSGNESAPSSNTAGADRDETAPSAAEVTANDEGDVAIKLPEDAEEGDTVEVTVTPEGSDEPVTVTLTKQPDGTWASDKPETVPSTTAENPNSTTIPEDKVKDGSDVTVVAKDPSGNSSEPYSAVAASPDTDGDGTSNEDERKNGTDPTVDEAPKAPNVTTPADGSVAVDLPTEADVNEMTISYKPEGQNDTVTTTLTKGENGWTSDDPNVTIANGKAVIAEDKVADGSEVKAVAKDAKGQTSPEGTGTAGSPDTDGDGVSNEDERKNGTDPEVDEAPKTPNVSTPDDGSVAVDLPTEADVNEMTISYKPEGQDDTVTATLTKGENGWTSNDPNVTIANGKAVIAEDKVADGSEVKAVATDAKGQTSPEGTGTVGSPDTDGDGTSNEDERKNGTDPMVDEAPKAPTVTTPADGSVAVDLPTEADVNEMTISYKPEGQDDTVTATLTKGENGWTSDDPNVTIANGKAVIAEDKVADGSEVKAVAKDAKGQTSPEGTGTAGSPDTDGDGVSNEDERKNDTDPNVDEAPNAPNVSTPDDGSVAVDLPTEADVNEMTISYKPEGQDDTVTATLTKGENGWTSDDPNVTIANGKAVIAEDKVADGSEVKAVAKDAKGQTSPEGTGTVGSPDTDGDGVSNEDERKNDTDPNVDEAPNAPNVSTPDDGSVAVDLPTEADVNEMTISYKPEGQDDTVTATLTKGENGWTSSDPNVTIANGKAVIAEDKVADGSEVKAVAKDAKGQTSQDGTGTAGSPDTDGDGVSNEDERKNGTDPKVDEAPKAPNVSTPDDGSVAVDLPTEADVNEMTISYKPEGQDDTVTATLTKGENGWTSDDPNVTIANGKAVIAEDKVADGSEVKAVAKDAKGQTSPEGTGTVGSPDTDGDGTSNEDERKNGTDPEVDEAPKAPTVTTPADGSVAVDLPTEADVNEMTISYKPEGQDDTVTATLTKGENGWTSSDPNVTIANGKAVIAEDKVADGSEVKAVAKDAKGQTSPEGTGTAGSPDTDGDGVSNEDERKNGTDPNVDEAPEEPTVTPKKDGSVEVKLPSDVDAKEVVITYTPEGETDTVTATVTKGENGWTSSDPNVTIADGKAVIAEDKVAVGEVKAVAKDKGDNASESAADAIEPLPVKNPVTVEANADTGVVTVTPGEENTRVELTFTDETGIKHGIATTTKGQERNVVAKVENGKWVLEDNPYPNTDTDAPKGTNPAQRYITIDENTGVITLNQNATLEGTSVSAVGMGETVQDSSASADAPVDVRESKDGFWYVYGTEYVTPGKEVHEYNGVGSTRPLSWTPGIAGDLFIDGTGSNEHLIVEYVDNDGKPQKVELFRANGVDGAAGTNGTNNTNAVWLDKDGNDITSTTEGIIRRTVGNDGQPARNTFILNGKMIQDGSVVKVWEGSYQGGQDYFVSNGKGTEHSLDDLDPVTLALKDENQVEVKQSSWARAPKTETIANPTVVETNGSVKVTPGADNLKVVITYNDENGEYRHTETDSTSIEKSQLRTIELTRTDVNSDWTMTIKDEDNIQTNNLGSDHVIEERGGVNYIVDKNGNAVKTAIVFNAATGEVTLPATEVRGGTAEDPSKVTAVGSRTVGTATLSSETQEANVSIDNTPANDAELQGRNTPSFKVENNELVIDVNSARNLALEWTDETGKTQYVYFHRTAQEGAAGRDAIPNVGDSGTWYQYNYFHTAGNATGNYRKNDSGELVSLTDFGFSQSAGVAANTSGKFIHLPLEKLQTGSSVSVHMTNVIGNRQDVEAAKFEDVPAKVEPVSENQGADKPVITPNDDGSVTIKSGANNDKLVVTFFDETNSGYTRGFTDLGSEGPAGSIIPLAMVPDAREGGSRNGATTYNTVMKASDQITMTLVKGDSGWEIENVMSSGKGDITKETKEGTGNIKLRDIVNGADGLSFTLEPDSVMGNTAVNATGYLGSQQNVAESKTAEIDAPTVKPKAYIETVAEMSQIMQEHLTAEIRTDYYITDKSMVINPETLTPNNDDRYYAFNVVYTNQSGQEDSFFLVNDNGWKMNYQGKIITLGSLEGAAQGFYVYNDLIVLPKAISNGFKEGTDVYLLTLDKDKDGAMQLLDSYVANPPFKSPIENYRLTYKGTKPSHLTDEDYMPTDVTGGREFIGTYFHNGGEGHSGQNWLSDFTDNSQPGDKGMIIDMKNDGLKTAVSWVYEPYLRILGKDQPLFIRGDSNDGVDLGNTRSSTGYNVDAYLSGQRDYNLGNWTKTGETLDVTSPDINNQRITTTYDKYTSTDGYSVYIDNSMIVY